MKKTFWTVFFALYWFNALTVFGQSWPFNASDPVYGLRSRVATNPDFQYFPSPEDWRDINIYQIFTDRFADGDDSNNPRSQGWYVDGKSFPANRNYHHGGDWKGLKNNLDYLSGMGVKAIWMSGVQMNDQGKDTRYTPYHMYHPTDFFKVDPVMGTFQDLKDVIDACHARGMYVILDVVINHTADKNGLRNGVDDTWYWPSGGPNFGWWNDSRKHAAPFDQLQYFHGNGTINNWDSFPEYIYGQFKGTDDLATGREDVKAWLAQAFTNLIDATDCDGFRVDAIKHVDYNWIKGWADVMRKHAAFRGKNDFILFGEYFTYDNNTLASHCKDTGYSFNSALFFPLSQNIKSVFIDNQWAGQLTQQLNNRSLYGEGANRLVAFIDNHDVNRISLLNGGDTGNDVWKLGPALSFLYLATPVPCLFYGTEHAFDQGGHYNGSNKTPENPDDGDWQRETMFDRGFQPGPAQGNKLLATAAPLYQHIKALNTARDTYKSLTRGSFQERWSDGAYAFSRVYLSEESLVAINIQDGAKSINVSVGKPNGTEFVNALNPSDKLTVAGGQLNIAMSGKQTKVYVAGLAAPQLWLKGTHNSPVAGSAYPSTPVSVNVEAGPTGTVASVKVGFSANSGTTWQIEVMTATNWSSQGGTWYSHRLGQYPAGTTIKYFIEAEDTAGKKIWDNNNGQDYSLTISAPPGVWVRGTQNYPVDGEATDVSEIMVQAEAGPSNTVTRIETVYSVDATNWMRTNMTLHLDIGSASGRWYRASLGTFPAGAELRYFVEATDGVTTNKDDNAGAYHRVTVRSIAEDLWVGNVRFTPLNGAITPADVIDITSETWPPGVATNVAMAYTIDGGATWALQNLSKVVSTNNDVWSASLGPYPDGTVVQFAVVAKSSGPQLWDNNGGPDYRAIIGELGVRMAAFSPVISSGGAPDNLSDSFDFNTTGGSLTTAGTNGFGHFGDVYVNYDASHVYIGAAGVAMPTDSVNNAYMIFVSGGTNAGSENLWNYNVSPAGLNFTHNLAFQPPVQIAILLGDAYGDGTYFDFGMYQGDGFNFGQGVFALHPGAASITAVEGARLSQFGQYGANNRLAANWESAIPLSAFGVTNASQLTNLYLSGVMVTAGTNGNNRFISGRYLGGSASLGNNEQPDAFGNFGFSFVNLGGTRIIPPRPGVDLGVPPDWFVVHLPTNYPVTPSSDYDGDGIPDRAEYFTGLDPRSNDRLEIDMMGGGMARVNKFGGQSVTYIIEVADRLVGSGWNWSPHSTRVSTDGTFVMPSLTQSQAYMRIRVNIPDVNQPSETVSVSASPPGGSFSAGSVDVTLAISGVNILTSTYRIADGVPVAFTNGQMISLGAGMTNGQVRTLTLDGSTMGGRTDQKTYTFTKVEASLPVTWTGNLNMDPASGSWDTNEALTITFATAPVGSAASVGMVFSSNGGVSWSYTNLTKTGASASNDLWSINAGSYPAGTVLQFALETKDSQNNSTWNNNNNNNYSIAVNGGLPPGGSKPYSTNPTKGLYRASGITIDGSNTGNEWTTDMIIALDKANDDPRSLGSNWTMHEAPLDFTHLWACWDDAHVYLAWQMVDVTDVLDPSNAGSGDPVNRNDGILMWAVFDTKAGGATGDMWTKSNLWTGANTPDAQIYMAGSLWQGYMGRAVSNAYNVPPGGAVNDDYKTAAGWGITYAKSAALIANDIWGVNDCDDRNGSEASLRDFKTTGHARTDRDSFYEIKIPMTSLGITKAQLESQGIAVMVGAGSVSALDTIPNSSATTDTPGVQTYNSSFEWGDTDLFTEPFARIGH